jgi:hypothetical protein
VAATHRPKGVKGSALTIWHAQRRLAISTAKGFAMTDQDIRMNCVHVASGNLTALRNAFNEHDVISHAEALYKFVTAKGERKPKDDDIPF